MLDEISLVRILSFGVVSPLLIWGLWVLAEESLIERVANQAGPMRSPFSRLYFARFLISALLYSLIFLLWLDISALTFIAPSALAIIAYNSLSIQRERDLIKKWRTRLDEELPMLVQVTAILVASGMSPVRAFDVVADHSKSDMGKELRKIVDDVKAGRSMIGALDAFAARASTTITRRFATTISMALERGSPLAAVLVDFVRDARNEERNQILRKAGKAEIGLMVPVVFLILPISVLFALWPSLMRLTEIA